MNSGNPQPPIPNPQTRFGALGVGRWALGVVALLVLAVAGAFAQDMPDPSLIHGRAIPAPELPAGTVTVRVVREAIGNNVAGQQVRVTAGGATRTATTDELGRAEFAGLPAGGEARAETTVDGEALVSQPFAVPATGGLRVILVAGLANAAARRAREDAEGLAAPPTKGAVVFGPDSRIIMEFHDDALFAFYVLEVVNSARSRVDTGGPIEFDLPEEAIGAAIREGSSPSATVNGTRVTIAGPFAPGTTAVQVQFRVRYDRSTHVFTQAFPIPLQRLTLGIQKRGSLSIASPQFQTVNDVPTEDGNVYVVGSGLALAAGTPVSVTLSNLPAHSPVPRYVALGLALAVAVFGTWLAVTAGKKTAGERAALEARRDALLDDLARLEAQRRAGTITAERYETRRTRIVGDLERIYGQLDEASSGPQGGGEGLAA